MALDECEKVISSFDRNMTQNLYAVEFEEMVNQILGEEKIYKLTAKHSKPQNKYVAILTEDQKQLCKLIIKTLQADQVIYHFFSHPPPLLP